VQTHNVFRLRFSHLGAYIEDHSRDEKQEIFTFVQDNLLTGADFSGRSKEIESAIGKENNGQWPLCVLAERI
jgi:hypothetical protein